MEPGTTIPWFDTFLSTNSLYTSYEVSGSMSFTGTGTCYGEVASATDLLPGTNDFTVEWFQKQSLGSDFPRVFQFGAWPSGFGTSSKSGAIYFWYNGQYIFRGLPTWQDEWIHIAICRYKNYVRIFHNDTQLGAAAYIPDNITDTETVMHLGIDPGYASTTYFTELISNFHVNPTVAKYWENFSAPTSGLNISYDSHLLLRASTNGSLLTDSSPIGMTVTTAGSTPIAWSSDKPFV